MNRDVLPLPAPMGDDPNYWLGRIAEVVRMERGGDLTEKRAMKQVRLIFEQLTEHDFGKTLRAAALVRESGLVLKASSSQQTAS